MVGLRVTYDINEDLDFHSGTKIKEGIYLGFRIKLE